MIKIENKMCFIKTKWIINEKNKIKWIKSKLNFRAGNCTLIEDKNRNNRNTILEEKEALN